MWAKLDQPNSVYYDITWVGYTGKKCLAEVERIFTIRPGRAECGNPAGGGFGRTQAGIVRVSGG